MAVVVVVVGNDMMDTLVIIDINIDLNYLVHEDRYFLLHIKLLHYVGNEIDGVIRAVAEGHYSKDDSHAIFHDVFGTHHDTDDNTAIYTVDR